MVTYLTCDEVRRAHHTMIEMIEGEQRACLHAGIYENSLSRCLERPKISIHGFTPFSDVFSKAAALLDCIVSTNVFVDGSKRTGFLACDLFLERNGYYIDPNAPIKRFLLAVAQSDLDLQAIAQWLAAHAVRK